MIIVTGHNDWKIKVYIAIAIQFNLSEGEIDDWLIWSYIRHQILEI